MVLHLANAAAAQSAKLFPPALVLETFFTLLATTARSQRFLLRPFRSQGLAVDKLEDQLLEDQNILNFFA